ncbi:hypothetical protein GCM10027347_61180 [Larkinella harenae]
MDNSPLSALRENREKLIDSLHWQVTRNIRESLAPGTPKIIYRLMKNIRSINQRIRDIEQRST